MLIGWGKFHHRFEIFILNSRENNVSNVETEKRKDGRADI